MSIEAAAGLAVVVVVGFIITRLGKQRKGGKGKPSGGGSSHNENTHEK